MIHRCVSIIVGCGVFTSSLHSRMDQRTEKDASGKIEYTFPRGF
jgi:hypothetical protein